MKSRTYFSFLVLFLLFLVSCKPVQAPTEDYNNENATSNEATQKKSEIQIGDQVFTIVEDIKGEYLPVITVGNQPGNMNILNNDENTNYQELEFESVTVDLSQYQEIASNVDLSTMAEILDQKRPGNKILLFLITGKGELFSGPDSFTVFGTSIDNVFLIIENFDMAMAGKKANRIGFSYIEQISGVIYEFVEDVTIETLFWMRHQYLQDKLFEETAECSPGEHWACVTLQILNAQGTPIPNASVKIRLGDAYWIKNTDEFGTLVIPLNSAKSEPSKDDLMVYDTFSIQVEAEGYGKWLPGNCTIFSAPYQSMAYSINLPDSGEYTCDSSMPIAKVDRVIPDDFFMTVTDYHENWKWGVLESVCEVTTDFILDEKTENNTGFIKVSSKVTNVIKGNCDWAAYGDERIKFDLITGKPLEDRDLSTRFTGADQQPVGSTVDIFNGLSVWKLDRASPFEWNGNQYVDRSQNYLDQVTGIRVYRTMITDQLVNGEPDNLHCQWLQIKTIDTNAPIGGNLNGYHAEFPQGASECKYLEKHEEPTGDPCIVMKNYYDWMDEENLDLFFQNYDTEGWSEEYYKTFRDWWVWYFNEYDIDYTLNSCSVEWQSQIPPFSAKLKGNIDSYSVYRNTESEGNHDVEMFAVFRNNDWFTASDHSIEDVVKEQVPFVNMTDSPVEVFWIDYDKNERSWFTLEPGEMREIGTSITHMWSFYNKSTGEHLLTTWISPDQKPIVIKNP